MEWVLLRESGDMLFTWANMLQINMCCERRYLDQNLPQTDEGRAELSQEEQTLEEVSPPLPAELRGREKLFRLGWRRPLGVRRPPPSYTLQHTQ